MRENAEEEKRIAIEKGNLLNGTPYITVIGDGGWAKRSYGHGMTSTGGVVRVVIIIELPLEIFGLIGMFCSCVFG